MRFWERRNPLLAPPSPNLADIHPGAGSWLAAYLWACGGKRAFQALLFVLCLPMWYPVGELFSPDIPIPPELARWSRQRESDMGSAPRRICVCVCGNEAGVGYWRWVQIRQGRGHRWCLKSASDSRTHGQVVAGEHFRIHPFLLWRWLLAQLLQVALKEGWGGFCCSHHLTFER